MSGPTPAKGHTLDLGFTLGLNVDSVCSEDIFISNHHCVIFHWSVTVTQFSAPMRSASSAGMLSEAFNLFFSTYNDVDILTDPFN